MKRRCLIVLLSDLFDDQDRLVHGLRRLRHAGHDVLVLHIMDPDELNFPFTRMTLFEGLEDLPVQLADPDAVREAYLVEVREVSCEICAEIFATVASSTSWRIVHSGLTRCFVRHWFVG